MKVLTTALVLLSVVYLATAKSGVNPCHGDKDKYGVGVTCTGVRIPGEMCNQCKLKPHLPDGQFADCASIYDLDDPACRDQLRIYAQENKHCDPQRVAQVQDMGKYSNRLALDYFVYSVCEECCDCIPRGASANQYQQRLEQGTLGNAYRGNCPAHAHYDICRVFPNIKYTMKAGVEDDTHEDWPKICWHIGKWIFSRDGRNWLYKSNVNMDWRIARFLENFWDDVGCWRQTIWTECTGLEGDQGRL
ncbi:hypothetical protein BWQ96_05794 [Gracilariopsis chorda]|uniref:Uncharacterized protein n=1 Tax=Gracilariopsis chorda TaxID=448386 RepID=A0A2V3IQT2_9FLOR|nr:hypothetical protein BWQ96_05794 [Gracilariopsis chorda]|eukprot:PXF44466.1 hypothetical protein BWQ96_05794 [Gracilariopsis chorda]